MRMLKIMRKMRRIVMTMSGDIEFACPALPRMRRGSGPWRRHVRRDGSHVMRSMMMMIIFYDGDHFL